MLLEHLGKSPKIHPSAYVAPNAIVCGDVTIGPGSRIAFGASIVAEGASIELGEDCIVMENAVFEAPISIRLGLGRTASSDRIPIS